MALTVEDGTGLAAAESYVSVSDCEAYCTAKGLVFASGSTTDKETALRRATDAIDAIYRSRFPGVRRKYRNQAKEWPRLGAADASGYPVPYDAVPVEIKNATCEAAVRELAEAGTMAPDLDRGGAIRRIKAGSVEVEYGANASAGSVFTVIDGLLSGLLRPASVYLGVSARG